MFSNRGLSSAALKNTVNNMLEKSNYKKNKDIDLGNDLLNGQGVGKLATCRYGFFPMSYNGCEIIAACNFRRLLGIPAPLSEVAREIYPYGNSFSGLFGTWPSALRRYFRDNGIKVEELTDYEKFKSEFKGKSYAVISFWNARHIFKGLHTVCIENVPEGVKVYNRSNKTELPVIYSKLDDYMDSARFIRGYISIAE